MRISRLHYPVTVLGPGRRLVLWTQGCTLACAGCVSRDTWEPSAGDDAANDELEQIWAAALADGADGLTVSGGEPLQQADELADLLERCVEHRADAGRAADADILLYTGYEPEELSGLGEAAARALSRVDALITGRYRAAEPTGLVWRGSANQRLTARTELGRAKYGPHLESVEDAARLQVAVDADDVRLIGIPRRGDLARFERSLRESGVSFRDVSWRP